MKKLLAKFLVLSVVAMEGGINATLRPVTSDSEENKTYSRYTPSGELKLTVTNPDVLEFFKEGEEIMLEMSHYQPDRMHTLTDVDMANNPDLKSEGLKTGDEIGIPAEARALTFGEECVGLSFNPSGDENVNKAKQFSAGLIDLIMPDGQRSEQSWIGNVLRTAAVSAVISAQMAVVKFITWSGK